ncbi:MAG: hypothetical protein WCJ30_02310 [Deltaproteobacteria bacterium]
MRHAALGVAFAALAVVPGRARAQSVEPVDTIEITAAPLEPGATPPVVTEPAAAPTHRVYTDEDDAFEDTGPVVRVRRPRHVARGESRAAVEALWGRHLGLGATVGVGSPLGLFGAFAEINIVPMFGLTLGGGAGGTFGPALGGTLNFRPLRAGHFAGYVGAGVSTNFLPEQYRTSPSIQVPANAWWFNLEIGAEYRSATGLALRLGVGVAPLMNTGAFTNVAYQNFYGPQSNTDVGWDPVSAADAHDLGRGLAVPYLHFDAFGLFDF